MEKKCPVCQQSINGRSDKRFCSESCKSSYHYEKRQKNQAFYMTVDRQLKTNRKILKAHNKNGFTTVKKQALLKEGFNPNLFTHYWKNNKGDVYLFVYDFGFLAITNKNDKKHLIPLNSASKDKLFFTSHSAHYRFIARKAAFRAKRFITKSLGHNSKASDFRSTCPLIPEKSRKAAKLHFNLHFEVKSALNSTSKDKLFFTSLSAHSPAPDASGPQKKLHSGQSASLQKSLGHDSKACGFYSRVNDSQENL